MITRYKSTLIALFAGAALMSACSSSPDVPDEAQEAHSYKSAQEDDSSSQRAQGQQSQQGQMQGQQGQMQGQQGQMQAQRGQADIPEAVGPIAHIDGEPVSAERFNEEMEAIVQSGQFPPEMLGQAQDQLIRQIVDKELVDRAVDEADVDVSEEKLDERLEEIEAEFAEANEQSGGQMGSLDEMMAQMGMTEDDFRDTVRESLEIEELLVERGMEYPSDEEIREFYEQNSESFERPAQVEARHILVSVEQGADEQAQQEAKERADEIHAKLTEEGADFADVAKEHSDDPSAQKGGELGWFGRGQVSPDFEEATFALAKGEISEPVRTELGWHIVQKTDEREAGAVPLDEIKPQLESKLRNQRVQEALQGLLADLREEKDVELHPENIN